MKKKKKKETTKKKRIEEEGEEKKKKKKTEKKKKGSDVHRKCGIGQWTLLFVEHNGQHVPLGRHVKSVVIT